MEYDDNILNKQNGLKHSNMIWEGTETVLPYSMRIIENVDRALKAFKIVYRVHSATVEGLEY